MTDYKELYFKLFRATEDAVNKLIAAQLECEELYMSGSEPENIRRIVEAAQAEDD